MLNDVAAVVVVVVAADHHLFVQIQFVNHYDEYSMAIPSFYHSIICPYADPPASAVQPIEHSTLDSVRML